MDLARAEGRKVATLGFSMERNVSLARSLGVLSIPDKDLLDVSEIASYPHNEVCVISTGSQGEPRSSLSQSAQKSGKWLKIDKRDAIVFSSRSIPKRKRIGRLVNNLIGLGATVIDDETLDTHTSGHGQVEEVASTS